MMAGAVCLFNLTPVANNYLAGKYKSRENLINTTYEHAVYYTFPYINTDSNFNGYMVAVAAQW